MKHQLSIILVLSFLVPLTATAQHWSPEEQEVIDAMQEIWDTLKASPVGFDTWIQATGADENLIWWFADQGVPSTLSAVRSWHERWSGSQTVWSEVRPVSVKIHGDVAVYAFYSAGEWVDPQGTRHPWEDKRVELLRKQDGQWRFIGGMVSAVSPN